MLSKIETDAAMLHMSMRLLHTNPVTGEKFLLEVDGSWSGRKVLVYLVRETNRERVPVCRIEGENRNFVIEIAAGIDVVLMMLSCVVLCEAVSQEHTTKTSKASLRDPDKSTTGNHSSRQLADVTLIPQTQAVVAPDGCIPVNFATTKLRVERVNGDLKIFERDTGEPLFRYDDNSYEEYFKRFLVVSMKLKFTDSHSGVKLTLAVDGDWRVRKAVMWLTRSSAKKQRDPVCTIAFRDSGYDADVVSGVDITLIALFCIILNETANDFPRIQVAGAMMLTGVFA
ncbi:hypothetical protein FI667_g9888, partial [Globisporangium splendens]